MISELLLRFVVGGAVVSFFAILGGALKPKSFAGLFGAAPSVALATLTLTVVKKGAPYAAIESRSMVLGALAFFLYACLVCYLLMRRRVHVLATTAVSLIVWIVCALAFWLLFFG
jgi:hypothetical protein